MNDFYKLLVVSLVALATFATIVSLVLPYLSSNNLKNRMKAVASERDRLRAQQKAGFDATGGSGRLREQNKTGGMLHQLVTLLNLKKILSAEASREMLRQAGMRSEQSLVTYLALRVILPVVFAVASFGYATLFYSESIGPQFRVALALGAFVLGYYLPVIILKNKMGKRQLSIKRSWSDALDLLLICVESGMAVEPALMRVAKEMGTQSVALGEELSLTVTELSYLPERRKAYENFAKRTGVPAVKSVVSALIQSDRFGTPLGTALRALAQENRDARMAEAERKAAALPPKLTVPMICFFLPVIFVIILGPSFLALATTN